MLTVVTLKMRKFPPTFVTTFEFSERVKAFFFVTFSIAKSHPYDGQPRFVH